MTLLIVGLALLIGVHSTRIVAEGWRDAAIARLGAGGWKVGYSLVALAGLALVIWGYGAGRTDSVVLWPALPVAVRHVAALLTLIAFVLVVAAYVPGNGLKARLHHPMVLGVKTWALAHLVVNNTLADLVLFGTVLVWAVLDYRAARRRDAAQHTIYPAGTALRTMLTGVLGIAAWAVFAFHLHARWIGVAPLT
jgi:uncharacterized membrane protein